MLQNWCINLQGCSMFGGNRGWFTRVQTSKPQCLTWKSSGHQDVKEAFRAVHIIIQSGQRTHSGTIKYQLKKEGLQEILHESGGELSEKISAKGMKCVPDYHHLLFIDQVQIYIFYLNYMYHIGRKLSGTIHFKNIFKNERLWLINPILVHTVSKTLEINI